MSLVKNIDDIGVIVRLPQCKRSDAKYCIAEVPCYDKTEYCLICNYGNLKEVLSIMDHNLTIRGSEDCCTLKPINIYDLVKGEIDDIYYYNIKDHDYVNVCFTRFAENLTTLHFQLEVVHQTWKYYRVENSFSNHVRKDQIKYNFYKTMTWDFFDKFADIS